MTSAPKKIAGWPGQSSLRLAQRHEATGGRGLRPHRLFRLLEQVRYKWRRVLVRFVVLTRDRVWEEQMPAQARTLDPLRSTESGKSRGRQRKPRRRAA